MAKTETTNLPATPTLQTGGKLQPIVPQSWNEAVQMAGAFVRAGMVPKHFENNTEKATVAILAGLEVGLTPMSALQSIAVINNMPTIFGDGMLALVRASGQLEDIDEAVDWDKQGRPQSATCRVKRKGEKTWGVHTFTMHDAEKGGLLSKPGPWKQYPQRMLQMRARAWALRDKFADVLRGLKSAEEAQDMVDITPVGSATTAPAEPQRNDFKDQPSSGGASPHSDPPVEGQPEEKAAGEGAAPSGQPDPKVTDVQDENEKPIEFEVFKTLGAFYEFSDTFLQSSATTPAMARKWEEFYREKIRGLQEHKIEARRTEIADTLALYHEKLKEEQPQ